MANQVKKFAKTGLLLMLGQASGQALSLLRNAIIGHLLSPTDFGIASTFTITVAIIEMASDIGSDKLLIQAKDGDNPQLQNVAQFFALCRGIIGCFIIVIAAPYIADIFKIPQAQWAFLLLALVPLARGFIHFDVNRFQREMNFFPSLFVEFIPQLLTCLLTFPFAFILKDYSAVIYLILLQVLFLVLMSHRFSKRSYKIAFDKDILKRLMKFGWPLMINGFLMFFIFQGDKFIIGIYYDMEKLGIYSAAFMITMTPSLLITKVSNSIALPFFSKKQDNLELLNKIYAIATEITLLIASIYSVFFTLYGDTILTLVFGKHYQGYARLVAILSFLWAIRIIRIPATLLALSKGYTRLGLISNIFRSFSLLGVFYFAINQYEIEFIAYSGCFGELLAILISLKQIKYRFDSQYRLFFRKIGVFLFSVISAIFYITQCEINFNNNLTISIAFLFLFSVMILSNYYKLLTYEKTLNN